ncbi:MAG: hypothetical protein FWH27_01305 [Planctomycetaceae bacterium]|nr:hypothetical protein [Planctomycetaceae bacterium]
MKSIIKYFIVLLIMATVQNGWHFVWAQMGAPNPDRPEFPDGTPGASQLGGMRIPPEFQDTPQPSSGPTVGEPNRGEIPPPQGGYPGTDPSPGWGGNGVTGGVERGLETPQSMQGYADEQPTLVPGGMQAGVTATGTKVVPENLKSVRNESHPIYDFLVTVTRPIQAGTEREVYLYEILTGVTSPAQRRELLKAYWNLSEKRLHCHVRMAQHLRLQQALEKLQMNQAATDEISLALELVSQQYKALELEFIQAQYRFLDLQSKIPTSSTRWRSGYAIDDENEWVECDDAVSPMPLGFAAQKPEDRPLPVPMDFPLAVPYDTKVEELKKQRSLSQKSLLLNHTIPLQYDVIVTRTSARQIADKQGFTVMTHGQSPVMQIEALAREEMALISTIIEYNHQVDEYVIETFGANIPEKQLLASILVLPKQPATAETGQIRTPTITSTFQTGGNTGQ